MKRLLNTLYVTTQGAYLNKEGEAIVVSVEHEVRLRLPVHTVSGIVCFGNIMISPFLLGHCAENHVTITHLTENVRFLARVEGPVSGNILLRREQYRRSADPDQSAGIARAMVAGKLLNARTVLQRALRDHPDIPGSEKVEQSILRLDRQVQALQESASLDVVRGLEGDASHTYFDVFDHLVTAQKESFFFHGRSRRPPMDNLNALLSFVYTLMVHDARSACEGVGLDPQAGFLHRDRPGRPSLALDLMEEFRSFLGDRLALTLINLRQVQGKGFKTTESGAVEMADDTRKELLVAYQKRKQEPIEHPFINEKVEIGLLFHVQALLLARHLRGDLDGYPPFIWK